ncbi:hypothetical protein VTK26DRAFT_7098 [Humicola hyalothermophila]
MRISAGRLSPISQDWRLAACPCDAAVRETMGWGYADAFWSSLANVSHGGGRRILDLGECPSSAWGSLGGAHGGELIRGNGLCDCVVKEIDGAGEGDGYCDFQGCERGRRDVCHSAVMARPTGREKEGKEGLRDDGASGFAHVLVLERPRETDSRHGRQARWIYVK